MRILTRRTALTAVVTGAIGISLAAPALADYAPAPSDVVGAGSDTLQYMVDFAADGHPGLTTTSTCDATCSAAASGYNAIGNAYKLVSIDATADANARNAYANGSATPISASVTLVAGSTSVTVNTSPFPALAVGMPVSAATCTDGSSATAVIPANDTIAGINSGAGTITLATAPTGTSTSCTFFDTFGSGLKQLSPSFVFRAGMKPIYRPNGSGDGMNILASTADQSGGLSTVINFARSSSSSNQAVGVFDVVRIAKEDLAMAVSTTTHATAALTTLQLAHIYQCDSGYTHWNDSGVYGSSGGASGDTIVPEIPQSGSGTRNTFLADLNAALGTTVALGSCVATTEENDPVAVSTSEYGNPLDTISPFSSARLALYNAGYFNTPGVKFGNTQTTASAGIQQLGIGNANSGVGASNLYDHHRSLYLMLLPADVSNAVGWQPGQSNTVNNNWAHDLFIGSFSYFGSATGQALVAAAGGSTVTGDGYSNCGATVTSC